MPAALQHLSCFESSSALPVSTVGRLHEVFPFRVEETLLPLPRVGRPVVCARSGCGDSRGVC
eukprot:scaffold2051_cov389-Prasinococcus_capsulatus_cf.AAC.2